MREAAHAMRVKWLEERGLLHLTFSPEMIQDMVEAAWGLTKWAPLGDRTLKEFAEAKQGSVYVGITCRM